MAEDLIDNPPPPYYPTANVYVEGKHHMCPQCSSPPPSALASLCRVREILTRQPMIVRGVIYIVV